MKIIRHITALPARLLPILVMVSFMLMPAITAAVNWSADDMYTWSVTDQETPSYESEETEKDTQEPLEQAQLEGFILAPMPSWSLLRKLYSKPFIGHGRTQKLFSPPPELA